MTGIDRYINDALSALGISSDRELDRKLGFKGTSVSTWRTKRALPSDDAMVRLAVAGNKDPRRALLDLHLWRADTDDVKRQYLDIIASLDCKKAK